MIVETRIQSSCLYTTNSADSTSGGGDYSRIVVIKDGVEQEIWRGENFNWEDYKIKGGKFLKEEG